MDLLYFTMYIVFDWKKKLHNLKVENYILFGV